MGLASLAKGRKFKQLIAGFFRDDGWEIYLRSIGEEGDDMRLAELPFLSFELKNEKTRSLGAWMHQAIEQAHGRIPVVIFKRYGVAAREKQWALMEVGQFNRLLRMATFAGRGRDGRPWSFDSWAGWDLFDDVDDGSGPGGLHLVDGGVGPDVEADDDPDRDQQQALPAEGVPGLLHLPGDDVA